MADENMRISSPAFENRGIIPDKYGCKGDDVSPPLRIENMPGETKALALIVDDPDAPMGTWVHWFAWNIEPCDQIPESSVPEGAVLGKNDFGKLEYGGPCPPSGTHRYFFRLYALREKLDLTEGSTREDLEQAMEGKILRKAELMGTYSK